METFKFRTEVSDDENQEFITYIKFMVDKGGVELIMRKYNEWYAKFQTPLKVAYKVTKQSMEFMPWTRHIFYIYCFDQYKKDLQNDINELTKGVQL